MNAVIPAREDIYRLYKGNSPFAGEQCFADFLNQSLRTGIGLASPWLDASRQLDALVAASTLKLSTTLYRATVDHFVTPYVKNCRLIYPAYMSTSKDVGSIYRHFATAHRHVVAALLCIECPADLPALDMEGNATFGGHEYEVLLPRDAEFELVMEAETHDPSEIAAVTSPVYAASYTSLRTYSLKYVA